MPFENDVVIVGRGLAGLACAKTLVEKGISCRVFEASDRIGCRVKTDRVDGFQLDHGFVNDWRHLKTFLNERINIDILMEHHRHFLLTSLA